MDLRTSLLVVATSLAALVGGALAPAVAVEDDRSGAAAVRAADEITYHDVPRILRYSVRVKGDPGVSVRTFARQAQETYDHAAGWSGRGLRFVRVASGGDFTLWISEARLVPSFSSGCSATWSCRVGRNVIINATRWRTASPAWNAAGRSLRDYRHMVVNHETGHRLGFGHASCPRRGAAAPVMMQQSKGTAGCRFNPWPTTAEIRRGRMVLGP